MKTVLCALRIGLCLASLALAGCETVRVVEVDGARLAPPPMSAGTPETRLLGRVALVMPPAVLQAQATGDRLRGAQPTRLQWPVGRLVAAALLQALEVHFSAGVQQLDGAPDGGFAAVLRVTEVALSDDESLRYFIPVPIPGVLFLTDSDTSLQMSFELQMLDERGRPLWTRRYDSGRVLWQRLPHTRELPTDGLVRVAHDTARQLAEQAARDVRAWVQSERMKPRQL